MVRTSASCWGQIWIPRSAHVTHDRAWGAQGLPQVASGWRWPEGVPDESRSAQEDDAQGSSWARIGCSGWAADYAPSYVAHGRLMIYLMCRPSSRVLLQSDFSTLPCTMTQTCTIRAVIYSDRCRFHMFDA